MCGSSTERGKHLTVLHPFMMSFIGYSSTPPSSYVSLVHMDYLQKICNENGSSLKGLNYIGGPVHVCEENDNQPETVPCVSFPNEKDVEDEWKCPECQKLFNIEQLLNPKVCMTQQQFF